MTWCRSRMAACKPTICQLKSQLIQVRWHMGERIPYSIPHRRALSAEERSLLRFLLEREAPARVAEAASLKVVARCGCGKCPTVLFGPTSDAEPLTGNPVTEVSSYRGRNAQGVEVGVTLIERSGRLAELEAWSPEGPDVLSWPPLLALERFE